MAQIKFKFSNKNRRIKYFLLSIVLLNGKMRKR